VPTLDKLPAFDRDVLTVTIETPKGCQNKYAYEPRYQGVRSQGILPAGRSFPFDFGFVPSTLGDHGDPLPRAHGQRGIHRVSRAVQLIGAIAVEQTEDGKTEGNDRLLAVAAKLVTHRSLDDLRDVNDDLLPTRAFVRLVQPSERQDFRAHGTLLARLHAEARRGGNGPRERQLGRTLMVCACRRAARYFVTCLALGLQVRVDHDLVTLASSRSESPRKRALPLERVHRGTRVSRDTVPQYQRKSQ
jgi:inorganic pyrophosphatase